MSCRLTLVSTGRADWSGLFEVLRICAHAEGLAPRVLLGADAADARAELARAGISCPTVCLDAEAAEGDSGHDAARRLARWTAALAEDFATHRPDCLLVVGDRYELLAVLAAAVPMRLPLAHVSGGEVTEGALDEQVRHAITKAAHLHFVAHRHFADRLQRMGEEAWRIHVTGDPALDRLARADLAGREELEAALGMAVDSSVVLVGYHPVTNEPEHTWREWAALEAALGDLPGPVVVTGSNADPQGARLRECQERWCAGHPRRRFVGHLGQRRFLGLLQAGACLIGNTSAGIWEAPSVHAPAINIGMRQRGRLRAGNVIDVETADADALRGALRRARDPLFRQSLQTQSNPYGDGHSAPRIVAQLQGLPARSTLLTKRFIDDA